MKRQKIGKLHMFLHYYTTHYYNREKNQANIKKFIEEQKNQGFKQNKVLYCRI